MLGESLICALAIGAIRTVAQEVFFLMHLREVRLPDDSDLDDLFDIWG